jgi:hypothetical protein
MDQLLCCYQIFVPPQIEETFKILKFSRIQCENRGYHSGVAVHVILPSTYMLWPAFQEDPPLLGAEDEGTMIYRNVCNDLPVDAT